MMRKWDSNERERKLKGPVETKPENSINSGLMQGTVDEDHGAIESYEGSERQESRVRRLELPGFDGTNPEGWVFRDKCYFSMNSMPDREKVESVFEGDTLAWLQWE
ncbi:Uncharacterized protein Adt_35705 [Abeliophyllum distichum]|uniref:Uncharacterized protein n=1 Tax=Abeliophyllum distichum TaxID=126358 RepID=A0ABD1QIY4_9LAMI